MSKYGRRVLLICIIGSLVAFLPAVSFELSGTPYSLSFIEQGAELFPFGSGDLDLRIAADDSHSEAPVSWHAGAGFGYYAPVQVSTVTFLKGYRTIYLLGGVRITASELLHADTQLRLHYANYINTNTYFSYISFRFAPQVNLSLLLYEWPEVAVGIGLPLTLSLRRDLPVSLSLGAALTLSIDQTILTGGNREEKRP